MGWIEPVENKTTDMDMKKNSLTLLACLFAASSALADVVYVTACVSNCVSTADCGNGANQDYNALGQLIYNDEGGYGAFTSAKAGTPDKVTVPGARYHSDSFANSTPEVGITLWPSLGVPGGVYKVYHVYSSTANNVSTDIIVGFTSVEGCTLSWTTTDKFQRQYGQPAPQSWQFLGLLTCNADTADPRIRMYYVGGAVSAGAEQRLVIEQFKFVLYEPCTDIPVVGVTGPLSADSNQVVVTGVDASATEITVYQDSGSGMVQIGKKTSDVTEGNNTVAVSGLVRGAKVAATQTLGGVEGCKPPAGFGVVVGGGANPRIRVALSIRENPTATGPAGANGSVGWNSNIHFAPATSVLPGSCPGEGTITLHPSRDWQTVTVDLGRVKIGNSANVTGVLVAPPGWNSYPGTTKVAIRAYAYKTVNDTTIFSPLGAQSDVVTSNDAFNVNWSWDAVEGAEGYRLLRNVDDFGYSEYVDVAGTTFADDYWTGWIGGDTVTPNAAQTGNSIMWYSTVGNANNIDGTWGVLESIAFAGDDGTDSGPFDIYIDNLANGRNGVFQDFEGFVADTVAGVVFNQPGYSGTTSGNLLTRPDEAVISNAAADTGTKSIRVRWQFTSGMTNLWMRFNTFQTSVMPSPLVNLDEPISFRILIQPVGETPVPPPAPVLTVDRAGSDTVLSWTGAHRLQAASEVTGVYTNLPGVTVGPWANTFTEPQKFFRLRD